jgi:hypothetical protein
MLSSLAHQRTPSPAVVVATKPSSPPPPPPISCFLGEVPFHIQRTSAIRTLMLHFCCADNIVAMVLRYLPKFSSTSLEALLVEESIQKKQKAEKVNFYLQHNF